MLQNSAAMVLQRSRSHISRAFELLKFLHATQKSTIVQICLDSAQKPGRYCLIDFVQQQGERLTQSALLPGAVQLLQSDQKFGLTA